MASQTMHTPGATLASASALLDQCRTFIAGLSTDQYTAPCDMMFGATIGQHVRHALDHFSAALSGMQGATIDYDHRERDTLVEKDPREARRTIDQIVRVLSAAPAGAAERPVTIRVMITGDGDECELASTLGREMAFATHHAVHHHAMIATIASTLGVTPPKGFGKAPSTIDHERRTPSGAGA